MLPIIVSPGGFDVHTWGLTAALGFLLVAGLGLRRCRGAGLPPERAADALLAAAVAGVVGARAYYVLGEPALRADPATWLDVRGGGASFFGALLFAIPAGTWMGWLRGLPVRVAWDAFATALPFGFALSRLGCLGAGCCYGQPTGLPWGVHLPGHDGSLHPTQLYEALWQLGLGISLHFLWGRPRRQPGAIALMALFWTGLGRMWIDGFRGDAPLTFVIFTEAQGLSMLAMGVAALGLQRLHREVELG